MQSDSTPNGRFVWHRSIVQRNGPKTHALVIGTSYYEHINEGPMKKLGLKTLDCAASAGYRFSSWLKTSYRSATAPLGSIRFLASPSEAEMGIADLVNISQTPHATAENVEEALHDWEDDCQNGNGNVALLYVSGHGVLESPDQVYVLLQDAFARLNLRNALSIAPTQLALGCGTLSASIIFVDACQQILPDRRWNFSGGVELTAPKVPMPDSRTCAPIYYASSPGTSAFGQPGQGTYFCDALIKCLEVRAARQKDRDSGAWSVSTTSLNLELPLAVHELASDQRVRPAGWGQDREVHELSDPPVLPLQLFVTPREKARYAQGILKNYCKTGVQSNLRFADAQLSLTLPCGSYSLQMVSDPPSQFVRHVYRIVHSPPLGGNEHIDLES